MHAEATWLLFRQLKHVRARCLPEFLVDSAGARRNFRLQLIWSTAAGCESLLAEQNSVVWSKVSMHSCMNETVLSGMSARRLLHAHRVHYVVTRAQKNSHRARTCVFQARARWSLCSQRLQMSRMGAARCPTLRPPVPSALSLAVKASDTGYCAASISATSNWRGPQ